MTLPLIPIAAGTAGVAAGSAIHYWLTKSTDAWREREVFNARMRDMHSLALALNDGFSTCARFTSNHTQLSAWRGIRDNFGKFYGDVGTINWGSPSEAQVAQAKDYASKLYFWVGEYKRLKCGPAITPASNVDPYAPNDPTETSNPTDWAAVAKWVAVGLVGTYGLKTLIDLFGKKP